MRSWHNTACTARPRRALTRLLAAIACAALLHPIAARAQVATIAFENITSQQGLSDNYVLCAVQDRDGFLWFGTRDGLNRFDGHAFTVFRHDPANPASLADGSVKCLYQDHRGWLWAGTHSSGLDRFDRATEQFRHYPHLAGDPASIGDGPIASICEDMQGNIWAATRGHGEGVSRWDHDADRFTRFMYDPQDPYSLSSNNVIAVCRDSAGAVWVATADSGLNRYEPALCGFINHRTMPAYYPRAWGPLESMQADRRGGLWVIGATHAWWFNPASAASHIEITDNTHGNPRAVPNLISSIATDRGGTVWTTLFNHGVIARGPASGTELMLQNSVSVPNSIASNTVFCICEDNSGNLWFGTERGISRIGRRAWQFRSLSHNPTDATTIAAPMVRSLAIDPESRLLIGTVGGGMDRYTPGADRVEHTPIGTPARLVGSSAVNTLFIDSVGTWIGSNTGLRLLDRHGSIHTWEHNAHDTASLGAGGVWAITRDNGGRLWVGTLNGGLNVMEPGSTKFHHFYHAASNPASLSDNSVLAILPAADGAIWVGTDKGLNRMEPNTGRCRRFLNEVNDPTSISNNRVWYLLQDHAGAIWIATSGGGISRMDPNTGRCQRYMENNGFINNTACAIVPDSRGRMWASTNKGLACIDPAHGTIRNFGPADGLPVYEFHFKACARGRDGVMYFGGRGGVLYFHPDSLADNHHVPSTAITAFRSIDTAFRLDSSATIKRTITLAHNNNSFSIEFAALDFTNPNGNRYRYMLEGYDADWRQVNAAHRFAEYTSVPPGQYRFVVAGANSDESRFGPARAIELVVRPALWQTWWFRAAVVVAVCALVALALIARVRIVRRQERTERRVVEYQLQALRAQMNPHFLFNSLNSILHFVVRRDIESAHDYLNTFSSLVRSTLEHVRSDAVSLADELEMLGLYLRMESLRFGDRFQSSIEIAPELDPRDVMVPPMIIQPYVENAIRHGLAHRDESGSLSVHVTRRLGYLRCSIIDNGVGRQRSQEIQRNTVRSNREHGMAVTHNRLEALGRLHRQRYRVAVTDLVHDDGTARGTRVDILIPLDVPERSRYTSNGKES